MNSFLSKKQNSFIKLVSNNDRLLKNADDIVYAIRSMRRDIATRIDEVEHSDISLDEKDIEIAKLIREDQYLEALLKKEKHELSEIFFTENEDSNCIYPDVLQWYHPEEN